MSQNLNHVVIYTDGACKGNPGPGGWGVLLRSAEGPEKELFGGDKDTTNNRMELLAVIMALKHIKTPGLSIQVYTDSKYVCDAIEKKWLFGWKAKGWKKVKNVDLWQTFLGQYEIHKPKFYWVKGHSGIKENERCDVLATTAAQSKPTDIDVNYERYEQEAKASEGLDFQ